MSLLFDLIHEHKDFLQQLVLFSFLIVLIIIKQIRKKRDSLCPPGPNGIPFFGVLLSLRSSHPERVLAKWNKKYGSLFMAKFGLTDVVVIGSSEVAHEAFVKNKCFNGRPTSVPAFDNNGIVMNNNLDIHKQLRRFDFSVFRSLGVSRSSFESSILDIVLEVCSDIDQLITCNNQSHPTDVAPFMLKISSNVVSNLIFGDNVLKKNKELKNLIKSIDKQEATADLAGVIMFAPFLRHLPIFSKVWRDGIVFRENLEAEIKREIEKHESVRDANCPREFVDYFLSKMDKEQKKSLGETEQNPPSLQTPFNSEQLVGSVRDLFLAGHHTTASSLLWIALYLSKFTDVQDKMQEEIDDVIGSNSVSMSSRASMPFTQAVIHEIARLRPVVPLSMPHLATDDGYLNGYKIRKGTILLTNIWAMNHDESKYPDPEKFIPERHLDRNGKFDKNIDPLIFGVGGRSCLGRQLAMMELFITTVTLFQRFRFRLPIGNEPDMRGQSKISLKPKSVEVVISRR